MTEPQPPVEEDEEEEKVSAPVISKKGVGRPAKGASKQLSLCLIL